MKKTILNLTVLAIAAPILLSSCASIFSKSSYPVSISSNPRGAQVSITDKFNREVFKGHTPATVTLRSGAGFFTKAEYVVKISQPGYTEQLIPVNFRLDGWYFGNLLIGGVLGMLIIDPATGAMWRLDTPPIYATLVPTTNTTKTPALQIVDIANIPQEMKEQLVKIK